MARLLERLKNMLGGRSGRRQSEERQDEISYLRHQINDFENYRDLCDELSAECPIITKRGEDVLAVAKNAALLESRSSGARYGGSSHGLSLRIAKGIYYRPSIHSGKVKRGPDTPTVIDTEGTFTVTSMRAVYHGPTQNREWMWNKLIALNVERTGSDFYLQMPVSNRQRVSGILLDADVVDWMHQRVRFGLALYQGRSDDFVQAMRNRLAELKAGAAASLPPPET